MTPPTPTRRESRLVNRRGNEFIPSTISSFSYSHHAFSTSGSLAAASASKDVSSCRSSCSASAPSRDRCHANSFVQCGCTIVVDALSSDGESSDADGILSQYLQQQQCQSSSSSSTAFSVPVNGTGTSHFTTPMGSPVGAHPRTCGGLTVPNPPATRHSHLSSCLVHTYTSFTIVVVAVHVVVVRGCQYRSRTVHEDASLESLVVSDTRRTNNDTELPRGR